MMLGKVIGNVVSVIKDENYKGLKLMVIQEMDMDGGYKPNFVVAADLIGVGIDETVMVANGTPARATEETKSVGLDSIIVAKIEKLIFEDRELNL
ncbi:MAG: EutN/CcmL family microcompartment protein [Actinomycetota bacterium]|jgi:ethanolamine utilization protein EutN|nr:EutN/CcmL family microcompartment protein [Actinomycetota bacterium]